MKFKDADSAAEWREFAEKNQDPYGHAVVEYAERWASLMEQQLADGAKLEDIAEATSDEADTEGITGFMYGCAVEALAHTWEHGEALRRWHNVSVQIEDEGERANEEGGVLNPAILVVETNND